MLRAVAKLILIARIIEKQQLPPSFFPIASQGVGHLGLHERFLRRPGENTPRARTRLVLIRHEYHYPVELSGIARGTFLDKNWFVTVVELCTGNIPKPSTWYAVPRMTFLHVSYRGEAISVCFQDTGEPNLLQYFAVCLYSWTKVGSVTRAA